MEGTEKSGQDLFEQLGLEVCRGDVEVGNTYPIFGAITRFVSEDPGSVVIELNHQILARISVSETQKVELLKSRSFEPGIFVSTVVATDPSIIVDCKTVIFGRPQAYNA